jgi:peptide/histidine transporter 3/4
MNTKEFSRSMIAWPSPSSASSWEAKVYRFQKHRGSLLTWMLQVAIAACRKSRVPLPAGPSLLHEVASADGKAAIEGSRRLEHTEQLRCLDSMVNPDPWRLCTVTQVEELKRMVRLLPVWATSIVMSAVYSQMTTMFVLQGNTLDPRMGPSFKITAASLSIFDTIAVIVWALAYDRFIVPAVRSVTGHPRGLTQLQRMGIGLVISIFSMVAATHSMLDSKDYLPISIFWQVPRYFIIGAAEVFTFVGQIEFFYDQSPDAIRSMGSALLACHSPPMRWAITSARCSSSSSRPSPPGTAPWAGSQITSTGATSITSSGCSQCAAQSTLSSTSG